MNIRLAKQTKKTNINNPISKHTLEKKYCRNKNMPLILSCEALGYLEEVKKYLPDGEITSLEFETSMILFVQSKEPKEIVHQLISAGCCRR